MKPTIPTNCVLQPIETVKKRHRQFRLSHAEAIRVSGEGMAARFSMIGNPGKSHEGLQTVIMGATLAKTDYVRRAVICGQSLNEQMCSIAIRDHGVEPIHPREARQMFSKWLSCHAPKIPRNRAFQMMAAAAHIMRLLLEMRCPDQTEVPIWIRDGSQDHFISDILEMPEAECTEAMNIFKDTFNTFLADLDSVADADRWLEGKDSGFGYSRSNPKSKAAQPANPPAGMLIWFMATAGPTPSRIAAH